MRRFCRGPLLTCVTAMLMAGCPKSSDVPSVSIRPVENPVILHRSAQGVHFETSAMITNSGPGSIFLAECSPALQRNLNDSWVTVWTPICVSGDRSQLILAGDSAVVLVKASAYTNPLWQPQLDPRLTAGTDRLLWNISYTENPSGPRKELPSEFAHSDDFRMTEQ